MSLTRTRALAEVISTPVVTGNDKTAVVIAGSVAAGVAGGTLYTVQTGSQLHVTDMTLEVITNTNGADQGQLGFTQNGVTTYPLTLTCKILTGTVAGFVLGETHDHLNFTMPQILNAGDVVILNKTVANCTVYYYVSGYLETTA